jgi:hypothetical protein
VLAAELSLHHTSACWLIPVALMFSMVIANTVCSVVKYSAEEKLSWTVPLYNHFHGGNAVESFVESILTVQCYVKQQSRIF